MDIRGANQIAVRDDATGSGVHFYTTNPIESFNRALRKVSKTRSVFPTEDSLLKLMYLAIQDIERRWTQSIRSWGAIYSQLAVFFEERLQPYI